ncbi:MAG TPA: hypothetical protein VGK67_25065 [Myxococcales bacterium]|jgi:hypothetical protein
MPQRFPIRFENWYGGLSTLLLISPALSFVEVDGDQAQARMGWAFQARFPRSAVASAKEIHTFTLSRGVHGWAGRWLVNGAGQGLVSIDLQPEQRARVLGFPVRLRQLIVSVDDPAALIKALGK